MGFGFRVQAGLGFGFRVLGKDKVDKVPKRGHHAEPNAGTRHLFHSEGPKSRIALHDGGLDERGSPIAQAIQRAECR